MPRCQRKVMLGGVSAKGPAAADVWADARRVVAQRYPGALAAVLGAAAVGPLHNPTSDLDLVVIVDDVAPCWEGFSTGRWPVEAFVATRGDWQRYVESEVARRLPVVLHLTATGLPVIESSATQELQDAARTVFDRGPGPLEEQELSLSRRLLADLVDDLRDVTEELEAAFLIGSIAQRAAELALTVRGRWLGEGKWLARRLAEAEPGLASRLLAGVRAAHAGEPAPLISTATDLLARTGDVDHPPWIHDVRPELNGA